jgi:oleate hydratase
VHSPHFGLSVRDRLDLVRLALTPEVRLEGRRIDEFFRPCFFATEFWLLWTTIMGPLPQHSAMEMRRYMNRFLPLLPDLSDMSHILRMRFDQYEAIICAAASACPWCAA